MQKDEDDYQPLNYKPTKIKSCFDTPLYGEKIDDDEDGNNKNMESCKKVRSCC